LRILQKSLLARLVVYFSSLALVIVAILGFFSYLFFIQDLKHAAFEKLTAVSVLKEDVLNRWVKDKRREVVFLSHQIEASEETRTLLTAEESSPEAKTAHTRVDGLLRDIRYDFPDFRGVSLITSSGGRTAYSTDSSNEGSYRTLNTFFVEGKKGAFVQSVYSSPVTLKPTMTISAPLYGRPHGLIGVIAADIDLYRMDRIIHGRTGLGITGASYLVDRYNVLVSATRFGSDEFPKGVHSRGIDIAVGGVSGMGVYMNHRGKRVLGVYRWIREQELALIVEIEAQEVLRSARRKLVPVTIIGVGLVILLGAGVSILARRIARPILSIKDAALRVAMGDLDSKAPVLTEDEVGVLASSFNRMTDELKALYDELKKEKEHFRALIEGLADMIAVLDRDGTVKFASPSVERVMGYASEEIFGSDLLRLVHHEDLDLFMRELFTPIVEKGETSGRVTVRAMHRNGTWNVLDIVGRNLLDNPAVGGIVMNARDITEKIAAEKALKKSEEEYKQFFEEDLTGDYTALPDGSILTCNPAFAKIMGYRVVEEAKRKNLSSFYKSPEEFETFVELLRRGKKLEYHEKEMRNAQGNRVFVIENTLGKYDQQGRLLEIKGYIFDNTERKQLEETLHQAQKMEAIARLAGGIAHDFNNLLTAVIGYCDIILQRRSVDERTENEVREIKKAANRAASLTNQLLAYSRKQVLKPKLVDLNRLIANIENLIKRLIGEDIDFLTTLEPGLREVKIDPGQMEQVIMNLVVNSRDAMPHGGSINVETKNVVLDGAGCGDFPEVAPGNYVLMSVRDTGCGMDEKTMEKVFDPFFTTKDVGKGTGLGLSTVFGIVKQSGGHITVESAVNKGTTFRVFLPGARAFVAGVEGRSTEKAAYKGHESVLVVEDDDSVRRIITMSLDKMGYRVYEAGGPASALALWQNLTGDHVDLIITDVVMPQMDGKRLAERLLESSSRTKVLFISGYTDDAIIHRGVLEDHLHFLQKPFTPDGLAQKVREVLDG
jgi:PAS domain S-box-containing protein